jgi:polar amino acid transport system substrate-binding protein
MALESRILSAIAAVGIGLCAAATGAHADQLQDIKAKKSLVCGTFGAIAPFGYADPKTRETVGADVELCKAVAKELGVEAVVRGFPVGVHIPELKLGNIDIIIANLGYTKTRAEQIQFSDAYNVFKEVISVTKASGITTLDQLAGKKISATKGSTSETAVKLRLPTSTPMTFQDASSAFLALQQGKVDGFAINNVSAAAFALQSANSPRPTVVLAEHTYLQPVGIGMRLGETALATEINGILGKLEKSGYMDAHWRKWIGADSDFKLTRSYKVAPIKDIAFDPLP